MMRRERIVLCMIACCVSLVLAMMVNDRCGLLAASLGGLICLGVDGSLYFYTLKNDHLNLKQIYLFEMLLKILGFWGLGSCFFLK